MFGRTYGNVPLSFEDWKRIYSKEKKGETMNKDEQSKELKTLSPQHYTEASFNIEEAMLAVQSNIFFAELPADLAFKLKEEPVIKNALAKALWATIAMKHLCRAGTKVNNPVDQELCKVENYAHKSRSGEWI